MTTIVGHLSNNELEARYEAAADPVAKSTGVRLICE